MEGNVQVIEGLLLLRALFPPLPSYINILLFHKSILSNIFLKQNQSWSVSFFFLRYCFSSTSSICMSYFHFLVGDSNHDNDLIITFFHNLVVMIAEFELELGSHACSDPVPSHTDFFQEFRFSRIPI